MFLEFLRRFEGMNYLRHIFFFSMLTFGFFHAIYSQEVVATDGGYFTNSQGSLAYTLGEISTETVETSEGIFTQGFQQNFEDILTISTLNVASNFVVFPNPINDFVSIQWTDGTIQFVSIKMEDAFGKIVRDVQRSHNYSSPFTVTELRDLAPGVYFITVVTNQSSNPILFKIVKN